MPTKKRKSAQRSNSRRPAARKQLMQGGNMPPKTENRGSRSLKAKDTKPASAQATAAPVTVDLSPTPEQARQYEERQNALIQSQTMQFVIAHGLSNTNCG